MLARIRNLPHLAGFILLWTMFFLVLIGLSAYAFMQLIPSELHYAFLDYNRTQSFYVSQSTIQGLATWMRYEEDQGRIPTASFPSAPTGDVDWPMTYQVSEANVPGLISSVNDAQGNPDTAWSTQVTMDSDVNTTAGLFPHTYRVHVQTLRASVSVFRADYILQQSTFAKYGFFVGNLPGNGYYPAGPSAGWGQYYGEFHVNGHMPLRVQSDLFGGRYSSSSAPIHGLMTFTQSQANAGKDGVDYQSGTVPFDGSGKELQVSVGASLIGAYSLLLSQGRPAIEVVPQVDMPKTDVTTELPLAKGAWFGRNSAADSLSTASPPAGVNLPFRPNSGGTELAGVYISGDLQSLSLNVASSFTAASNVSLTFTPQTRDASGLINSGDPFIETLEKAQVSTQKVTRIIELRDPTIHLWVPQGSFLTNMTTGARSVTPASVALPTSNTVVYRQAGTTLNASSRDAYEIYPGFGNGVVYVDGNIGSVAPLTADQASGTDSIDRERFNPSPSASTGGISGVNYGSEKTIAVNYAKNRYLRIDGSLTRGDVPLGTQPKSSRRDGLGLVAYDVIVGQNTFAASPLYLYSLLMAGRLNSDGSSTSGSVIYEGWTSQRVQSALNIYGSYVVGNDRLWGSSAQGWVPNFYWDATLAGAPPPFYPTRSDYVIQAYREN